MRRLEVDGIPIVGLVRQVRHTASLSQRELAEAAGVSQAMVSRIEAGTVIPSLAMLSRLLRPPRFWLVAVDDDGRMVLPMDDWDDTRDGAGRRYPSHLDTILDPEVGEWWADRYGLARPPETFHRDRDHRDAMRLRSQWEVRAKQNRHLPPPPDPELWWLLHKHLG